MFIGIKNGNIVAFNKSREHLTINAKTKGITLDSIEETNEQILPYHNTPNDGIYFKASEVPPPSEEEINKRIDAKRRELYALKSDPLTNKISVLREQIIQKDFQPGENADSLEQKIRETHLQRKIIREEIQEETKYES